MTFPKPKETLLFGYGRMGQAIHYGMEELGYFVTTVDMKPSADVQFVVSDYHSVYDLLVAQKPNIVVSSLTYDTNLILAKAAIDLGIHYCDLGGNIKTSELINSHAKEKKTCTVFTDLGLAPGWINILAEHMIRDEEEVNKVSMMVGGLPLLPDNPPMNYYSNWSIEGLVNEYTDKCVIIEDGKKVVVDPLSRLEKFYHYNHEFEAFCTSGGLSHSLDSFLAKGIKDATYKTIRYPGHRDYIQQILDRTPHLLPELVENNAEYADVVVMSCKVARKTDSIDIRRTILGDEKFSAMQKATAFPLCAVASLICEDNLPCEPCSYSDLYGMYYQFEKSVEELGL